MNILIIILIINLLPLYLPAQSCGCMTQFTFVKSHYEKNNPAFQKIKINTKAYQEYAAGVRNLTKKIKKETSPDRCNVWFEKYISLLKDHHSGIDINLKRLQIDFNSPQVIDSIKNTIAYQSFKVIKVDTTSLFRQLAAKPVNDIEGIYTNGGSITFGLLKNKKGHYIAVVLKKQVP